MISPVNPLARCLGCMAFLGAIDGGLIVVALLAFLEVVQGIGRLAEVLGHA